MPGPGQEFKPPLLLFFPSLFVAGVRSRASHAGPRSGVQSLPTLLFLSSRFHPLVPFGRSLHAGPRSGVQIASPHYFSFSSPFIADCAILPLLERDADRSSSPPRYFFFLSYRFVGWCTRFSTSSLQDTRSRSSSLPTFSFYSFSSLQLCGFSRFSCENARSEFKPPRC